MMTYPFPFYLVYQLEGDKYPIRKKDMIFDRENVTVVFFGNGSLRFKSKFKKQIEKKLNALGILEGATYGRCVTDDQEIYLIDESAPLFLRLKLNEEGYIEL
jgi:hypothetical protein